MRRAISLRGIAVYTLCAITWFFFTTYNTNGVESTVNSKLTFLGEDSARFGGVSLYYLTEQGVKLKVRVDRDSYQELTHSNITEQSNCSVVYFKNESLIFNRYQSVKSIQCGENNYYSLSE